MPHFVIECSENVLERASPKAILQAVYEVADGCGLFAKEDVKVRLQPYRWYRLGESKKDFLHVFAYVMEGRTVEQRAVLSRAVIERLNELLRELSFLAMNASEFEQAAYCNKAIIHPKDKSGDRHFL